MNLAQGIIFNIVQLNKGNRNKKIIAKLQRDIYSFISNSNDESFNEDYDALYENRLFREWYVTGNLFPKDASSTACNNEIAYTDDIFFELRWILKTISKNAAAVTLFLQKKAEIDELVVNEEYDKAFNILSEIEKTMGVSLWSMETAIYLSRRCSEKARYSEIDKCKNKLVSTILGFYDMKSSDEVGSRDYNNITRREIEKFRRIYSDKEDLAVFYQYMVAPFSLVMNEENISYILRYVHKLSLVDKLLCVIDILEYYATSEKLAEEKKRLGTLLHYIDKINDPLIKTLCFIFSNCNERVSLFNINDEAEYLKNYFIEGRLLECLEETKKFIESKPINIDVYNLFIEVCQILGHCVEDINLNEKKRNIIQNLNDVYSVTDNYNDAIDFLNKQSFYNFHSTWGRDIFNNITRYVQPEKSDERVLGEKYSNIQRLTIETICANLTNDEALFYFTHTKDTMGSYREFRYKILLGAFQEATRICKVQQVNNLLLVQEKEEYTEYRDLLSGENSQIYKIRVAKQFWENAVSDNNIESGIDYFIHLFIQREEYAIIAPVEKFIEFLSRDVVNRGNIRVPILFYIYTSYFDYSNRDDLFIACEDFFDLNSIERPSSMPGEGNNYTKEELVFFLRYICVPQIMGPVLLSVRTSKGLDEERINICQYLCVIDSEREDIYEQEIKDITHKLFINDSVSELENSKIQVNTDGIKSRISKEMKSVFSKYMYSRNTKLDAFIDQIKSKLDNIDNISFISLDSSQIFNEIVLTIRNEFVLGAEYGLDAYLSLNIRHGTLAAQLRAPLAKKNLLAEYNPETDEYDISKRWLYWIPQESPDCQKVKNALIELTKETDSIIEYLRKELIQISTEEKPTNGIFRYHLESAQISILQTELTEESSFEEFIEIVFKELWRYTDRNLQVMRDTIRNEIKLKYMEALGKFQEVYSRLKYPSKDAERWITEVQNDMDAELERISNWFVRGNEGNFSDFDLDSAFQVSLKTIQNIHPEKNFQVRDLEKTIKNKLHGDEWKNYYTIFYTLLDNICKHAKEDNGIKYIDCRLCVEGKKVFIQMQNDIDCEKALLIQKRIDKAKQSISDKSYLQQAKKEGGSGIPKVYKIFTVDLRMNVKMDCYIDESNKYVFVVEGEYK